MMFAFLLRIFQRQIEPGQANIALQMADGIATAGIGTHREFPFVGNDSWHANTAISPGAVSSVNYDSFVFRIPTIGILCSINPDCVRVFNGCFFCI